MTSASQWFAVRKAGPWGDYGITLAHGWAVRIGEQLQLSRTGPFIPPLTMPGICDLVATAECNVAIARAGITGCTPSPVTQRKVVHVEWEQWPRDTASPPVMPAGGDPESYINHGAHDPQIDAQLGELYSLEPTRLGIGMMQRLPGRPLRHRFFVDPCGAALPDIFQPDGIRVVFVSDRVVTLLGDNYEWLKFVPAELGPLPPKTHPSHAG